MLCFDRKSFEQLEVACHRTLCQRTKNARLSHFFQRMISVIFNHCAHGGLRPKQTRFLCSHSHLSSLEAQCPGESDTHVHLPYAIRFDGHRCTFDTAIESEYPELLCKRIAQCLKDAFSGESTFRSHTNSASTGVRQTKKHASLIPEFHHIAKSKPINKPHKTYHLSRFRGRLRGEL